MFRAGARGRPADWARQATVRREVHVQYSSRASRVRTLPYGVPTRFKASGTPNAGGREQPPVKLRIPTLRQTWPRERPGAAMCVQGIDVQCVLQFTLINAASCALHRCTSRVIHRSELPFVFRLPQRAATKVPQPYARGEKYPARVPRRRAARGPGRSPQVDYRGGGPTPARASRRGAH